MYTITYRNVLKRDKVVEDFQLWLKSYWSVCRVSGAKALRFWRVRETGKVVLLWQVTVLNLENWREQLYKDRMMGLFHDLDLLTEPDQLGIEVRHLSGYPKPGGRLFPEISFN